MISTIVAVTVIYGIVGVVALFLFNYLTQGRIRDRWDDACVDMQSRLSNSGNFVGTGIARLLFAMAILLFWPFVFIGAMTQNSKAQDKKEK